MKRKVPIILLITMCLLLLLNINILANSINVCVDNKFVQLKDATGAEVYPFIQNGTTYVPLRAVSEILDCTVIWDGNNKTIKIYEKGQYRDESFRNNSNEIKVYFNSELIEFKTASGSIVQPFIENGTTYVPLRGISETLGCQVEWDSKNFTVIIWDDVVPPEGTPLYYLKPRETDMACYYDIDGKQLEIDGKMYSNAMNSDGWSFHRSATFDINAKYKSISLIAGPTWAYEEEKTVTFIVDGKIVKVHKISPNTSAEKIKVDLNYGISLKITVDGQGIGLGDVTFLGQ